MRNALVLLLMALLCAGAARADLVKTLAGDQIEGELELAAVRVRTTTGDVEVPRSALRSLVRESGTTVDVTLADGSRVRGEVVGLAELRMKTGLVVRVIPFDQVLGFSLLATGLHDGDVRDGYHRIDRYRGKETLEVCPLALELDVRQFLAGRGRVNGLHEVLPRTTLFQCDGLVLARALLSSRQRKGQTRLALEGTFVMGETDDKRLTIVLSLLAGEKVLAATQGRRLEAEEGKNTPLSAMELAIPDDRLDAALAGSEPITFRVRVDAVRN